MLNAKFCPHCRYDLGGLRDSSLCPECGKPFDPGQWKPARWALPIMTTPSVLAFFAPMAMPWSWINRLDVVYFAGIVGAACVISTALIAPRLVKYGTNVVGWCVAGSIVANGVIGAIAVGFYWMMTMADV